MDDLTLRDEISIEQALYGDETPEQLDAVELITPVEDVADDIDLAIADIDDDDVRRTLQGHVGSLRRCVAAVYDAIEDATETAVECGCGRPLRDVKYDLELLGFTIARVR